VYDGLDNINIGNYLVVMKMRL